MTLLPAIFSQAHKKEKFLLKEPLLLTLSGVS